MATSFNEEADRGFIAKLFIQVELEELAFDENRTKKICRK